MAKIMIIDDDIEWTDNLSGFLKSEGHTVVTSHALDGAVEKLTVAKPDLLILDVMFPENPVGGFDLARKIRPIPDFKSLPIIMLTGVNQYFPMDFSTKDIERNWMPIQDFVDKPGEFKELLDKINQLLLAQRSEPGEND